MEQTQFKVGDKVERHGIVLDRTVFGEVVRIDKSIWVQWDIHGDPIDYEIRADVNNYTFTHRIEQNR